ncbi:hypothetical protein GF389_03325 [Candidatus Dojkabacteria bacterium]|nr:hypothetical protein [Candidatus Dojkabacteria bacterium]
MSRSWVYLIGVGVLILVVLTGVQLYESLTGKGQVANYQVDDIDPSFGEEVLDHLSSE